MNSHGREPIDDESFLDSVFERALFRAENGLPVENEELADERAHLQSRVERTVRLAHEIAASKHRIVPIVPGYTVLHEIGRGGMGTVYLARQHAVGDRAVALKILPQGPSLSARARQRFLTEATAIGALHHPHIVSVHDVVHEGGLFAYAMEWIDGRSLADVLEHLKAQRHEGTEARRESEPRAQATGSPRHSARSSDPSMSDVRSLLDDSDHDQTQPVARAPGSYTTFICQLGVAIARALGVVHRANLLHRDVKPSNILLRRDGTPLLSDFGLVRETDTTIVTQAGHFVGTAAYASPEQLRGEHDKIDARSDVYSLGVTLYHALTLRLPYSGNNPSELLRQIETGKCPPIRRVKPALPRDLETIVSKAIDADPSRRYASADELADDLERLLNLQPIKAKPATMVTRIWKTARRNRASLLGTFVGGVVALLVSIGVAAYALLLPRWSAAELTEARLTLLDPSQGSLIFSVMFYGIGPYQPIQTSPDVLRRSLHHYDAALRWQPFSEEIRAERDVVALVLNEGDKASGDEGIGDRQEALGNRQQASGPSPLMPNASVPNASDLRSTGLQVFLHNAMHEALAAWTQLDLTQDPDPFVEAALGILHLANDEPARAYPRLQSAVKAFPNVSFLTQYLADAALQCGDFDRAERLLESAKRQPKQDNLGGLARVSADLLAAQGRDEEAIALYQSIQFTNPIGQFNYARLLELRSQLEDAVRVYARVCARIPDGRRPREAFMRALERWWDAMAYAERYEAVRSTLELGDPREFLPLLRAYRAANVRLEGARTLPGTSVPGERTLSSLSSARRADESNPRHPPSSALRAEIRRETTLPIPGTEVPGNHRSPAGRNVALAPSWLSREFPTLPRPIPSPYLQRNAVSLITLSERMEVSNVNRWNCLIKLPSTFKNWLAESWISHTPTIKGAIAEWCADAWCSLESVRDRVSAAQRASSRAKTRSLLRSSSLRRPALDTRRGQGFVTPSLLTMFAAAAHGQCPPIGFTGLGDLPGGGANSLALELSDDGRTVVGRSASTGGTEAFLWTDSTGLVGLGHLPGGGSYSEARGLSADGSVITGYSASSNGSREAFRWTQAGGMVGLGDLPGGVFVSEGDEVSADGTTIVGNGNGPGGGAFRWTQADGMVSLGFLPGGMGGAARGVSQDGTVVVGWADSTNADFLEAFRWTQAGGMVGLGDLPGGIFDSSAGGVSADGSIVVGGGSIEPYEGFRWTALTGMERLLDLPGGPVGSFGLDVAPDGSPIVGRANGTGDPLLWTAAMWDENLTLHRIADVLADNGVLVPCGWHLQEAVAIAENCGVVTIAGYGLNPNDDTEAWIASYIPGSPPAQPPTGFTALGDLPGGATTAPAYGVSADATTVVGYSAVAGGYEAFRWRAETGMVSLGDLPGNDIAASAWAVSGNGSVVIGSGDEGTSHQAWRWTDTEGLVGLGAVFSQGVDVSDDGLTIVGAASLAGGYVAARWTSGSGWQAITGSTNPSAAYGISRNGVWVTGSTNTPSRGAFRWSQGTGWQFLGDLPGGAVDGYGWAISDDGNVVVGHGASASGLEAFRWTPATGMVGLGELPGGTFYSEAWDVSADGSIILGSSTSDVSIEAVMWVNSGPIQRVADVLADNGVSIPCGWLLRAATDMTVNCGVVTIVGSVSNPDGDTEAFIVSYIPGSPPVDQCDDGNACTIGDSCELGPCAGTPINPAIDCNDNNPCTTESCNPASGCVNANNTNACNDNNACTTGDVCGGGVCAGTPVNPAVFCNDNNVCTNEGCNPASGCTHANNTDPCDDDNVCRTEDFCVNGTCIGIRPWGDVVPCTCPSMYAGCGIVNLDDILKVLAEFSGVFICSDPKDPLNGEIVADIKPCNGNGIVNIDDILGVLTAFTGANPTHCPCNP